MGVAETHNLPPAPVKQPDSRIACVLGIDLDGLRDHVAELGSHSTQLGIAEVGHAATRVDSGLVEDFVRDPIADAGREPLVEEYGLRRRRSASSTVDEGLRAWHRVERIEAELADGWFRAWVVTKPESTQSSSIGEGKLTAVVECELELGKAWWPAVALDAAFELESINPRRVELTGHAEVNERMGASVELEPHLLAVSMCGEHAPAPDRVSKSTGRNAIVDDVVIDDLYLDDGVAAGDAFSKLPASFDLGQLWHATLS